MNELQMMNALLNRFRRSMRARGVSMQAITPSSFYNRTLRRTTTCTSIQCTGSLHKWTNILQTGGGAECPYKFLLAILFSLSERRNPSYICKWSLTFSWHLYWPVLQSQTLSLKTDKNIWTLTPETCLKLPNQIFGCICERFMGSSWARRLRLRLF